ncbi:hypothetical protein H2248_008967 [Termitomyces sp. 'cryptogamus']|nr:hypothetical protein H2248_008967 [Termitomyces sp. 'cryptogamus']
MKRPETCSGFVAPGIQVTIYAVMTVNQVLIPDKAPDTDPESGDVSDSASWSRLIVDNPRASPRHGLDLAWK